MNDYVTALGHITNELRAEAILASFHEAREIETEEASAYGDESDGDHDEVQVVPTLSNLTEAKDCVVPGGTLGLLKEDAARRSKRKESVEARVERQRRAAKGSKNKAGHKAGGNRRAPNTSRHRRVKRSCLCCFFGGCKRRWKRVD